MKTKFNPYSLYLAILSSMIVSGCIHQPAIYDKNQPTESLNQTTICCSSFSQLGFINLRPKINASIYLNAGDPVMEFESGRSYVEPFLIPENNGITLLQIDSLATRNSFTKSATMVFPVVSLINSQFELIATLDNLPFTYSNNFGWKRIQVVVTIDDQFEDATYAVVHTSTEKLSHSLSTRKPAQIIKNTDFDTMLYVQPSQLKKRIRFTSSGVLNVMAYPL